MTYKPREETLAVLAQAGFARSTIVAAATEYEELAARYPDVLMPSDKDFVLFLRSKYAREATAVQSRICGKHIWAPGIAELKALEGEGYWREIISAALIDFLSRPYKTTIQISKFAVFRSYLRSLEPLNDVNVLEWYPSQYLIKVVRDELHIAENTYHSFMDHFKKLADSKKVSGKFLPRFFFYFVKKNRCLIPTVHSQHDSASC